MVTPLTVLDVLDTAPAANTIFMLDGRAPWWYSAD